VLVPLIGDLVNRDENHPMAVRVNSQNIYTPPGTLPEAAVTGESPLAKKLLLKSGQRGALVNAPANYLGRLQPLPAGTHLDAQLESGLDFVQLFASNMADLQACAPSAIRAVKPDGLLWVTYPKGGKRAGTDLNRDTLWEVMSRYGLAGVTLVAVDTTWSAMRFRPADQVGR
jgi:hypothetical protein